MIEYGSPPASDEIEVTLFGPGYGEAVAVHIGDGAWILIDSCIDPYCNKPASKNYLDALEVTSDQVRCIIASHWHDDHVRGISSLASAYPTAEFVLSGAFSDNEALAFLAAYSGFASNGLSSGARELYSVFENRQEPISAALHKTIIIEGTFAGRSVAIKALSPLQSAFQTTLARLASYIPADGHPITHAPPELKPNLEAVALHFDFGDDAVLLGSDLEDHAQYGWSALTAIPWAIQRRKASAYKVAHHGSRTGHCDSVWSEMLEASPIACMTPFQKGSVKLPTQPDVTRIKEKAGEAYLTSKGSRSPAMDSSKLKRLNDICENVTLVDTGFGVVRARKARGETEWRVELLGAAARL